MSELKRSIMAGGEAHLGEYMVSERSESFIVKAMPPLSNFSEDQRYYRYSYDEPNDTWIFIWQHEFVSSDQVQEAMDKACEPWQD